ncbi:MAG: hypothetical protein Ta2G_20110 [Termitinemataceae bacterium]|nr:MAG: hypothetical protein Ta2G_20110 [Termitinemataceae bacterium]
MDLMLNISIILFVAALVILILFFWQKKNKRENEEALREDESENAIPEGERGDARVCPICAALFLNGETVYSKRFPKTRKRFDRLLHIHGCPFCLKGQRTRRCPVCGSEMSVTDYLIARIWERPGKSHVHVQGCINCSIKRR